MGRMQFHGIEPRLFRSDGRFLKTFLYIIDLGLFHLVGKITPHLRDRRRRPRPVSAIDCTPRSSTCVADLNGDFAAYLVNGRRKAFQSRNMRVIVYPQHGGIHIPRSFDNREFDDIDPDTSRCPFPVIGNQPWGDCAKNRRIPGAHGWIDQSIF